MRPYAPKDELIFAGTAATDGRCERCLGLIRAGEAHYLDPDHARYPYAQRTPAWVCTRCADSPDGYCSEKDFEEEGERMHAYEVEYCKGRAGFERTLAREVVFAASAEEALALCMHGEDWPVQVRDRHFAAACNPKYASSDDYSECYIAERLSTDDYQDLDDKEDD